MTANGRIRCETCGVPNPLPVRFCRGCGTRLPERSAPSEAEPGTLEPLNPHVTDESAWREVRGVAWLFLLILALSGAETIALRLGTDEAGLDLAVTICQAIIALIFCRTIVPELRALFAKRLDARAVGFTLVGAAFLFAFCHVYFPALRALGIDIIHMTSPFLKGDWPRWAIYVQLAVVPALLEETMFRGYIMVRLARLLRGNEVLVVQAALFSVLHLSVAIFPSHFVMGLVFGLLRRKTGSLLPGMLVHAGWNAYVVWQELHLAGA